MKKATYHRAIFWTVLLSFSFMLTGKAIACFAPSVMEMSQGKSMDCCMERCRMEVTHEAAKKACEQSRQGLSPKETLASPHNVCAGSLADILSEFKPLPLFSAHFSDPLDSIKRVQNAPILLRHHASVQIYASIETFLI